MYFSQNISLLCSQRGWRTADLARELKITPQQAGRYINGKNQPKIETAILFAEVFDINLDDLILKDLSKGIGRPFGAEGENKDSTDATLDRMNELLEQRVRQLEEEIRKNDPDRARELGIE
jgi:transcriptional regulator with XRE-family HTH domain